jgi:membrane-bound serine protease (ClpP class)
MTRRAWGCLLVAAAALLSARGHVTAQEITDGFVVVCPITEMVDDGLTVVVERAVSEARGAKALIFEVDTFGGKVDSAFAITEIIKDAEVPTIAYIRGAGAISAGALISFACDHIAMEPATSIGGAQPVTLGPEGSLPTGEKEVSVLRSRIGALAEMKGHNPAIAQAMVDGDIELFAARGADGRVVVWSPTIPVGAQSPAFPEAPREKDLIDEGIDKIESETGVPMDPLRDMKEVIAQQSAASETVRQGGDSDQPLVFDGMPRKILASGKLLTLSTSEAETYGLTRSPSASLEQVLGLYGHWPAEVRRIEMTMAERIFRFLTNPMVSGILFMIALGGLYLELKTPGFGFPGIISITAFMLFFGARAVFGLAEWGDLLLIGAGVVLILLEVFYFPGFGLPGIAGLVCILAGFALTFTTDGFEIPQYEWQYDRLREAGLTLSVALVTFAAFIFATWKILPSTPAFRQIMLSDTQLASAGFAVQSRADTEAAVGLEGVAVTYLRPAGKGRFGNQTLQVVSRGQYLPAGTPIVIVQGEGNRLVVDPLPQPGADA